MEKRRFQGNLTGGLLAARIAAKSFQGDRSPLDQQAKEANRCIRTAQINEGIGIEERNKLWSTSLAVVHLDGNQLEYCQTGDALILFILKDGSYKVITPDIDIDRETLHLWKEMQVSPDALIHEVLAEQIHKVRLEMNISYGVLNGEPEAMNFILHAYENLTDVSDILLFTDGLISPGDSRYKKILMAGNRCLADNILKVKPAAGAFRMLTVGMKNHHIILIFECLDIITKTILNSYKG